jgi:hypothetical protein
VQINGVAYLASLLVSTFSLDFFQFGEQLCRVIIVIVAIIAVILIIVLIIICIQRIRLNMCKTSTLLHGLSSLAIRDGNNTIYMTCHYQEMPCRVKTAHAYSVLLLTLFVKMQTFSLI